MREGVDTVLLKDTIENGCIYPGWKQLYPGYNQSSVGVPAVHIPQAVFVVNLLQL